MPPYRPRPIQNAVGDARKFLDDALAGTNLREQMAEAAAREAGLSAAVKLNPWTTPALSVDPIPLTPDYAVPIGRADPWKVRQPDMPSGSAFASQMGSGASLDPQVVIGGSSAHKLPPIGSSDLGGMEEQALAHLNVSTTPVLKQPIREPEQSFVDHDFVEDPSFSMAELAAMAGDAPVPHYFYDDDYGTAPTTLSPPPLNSTPDTPRVAAVVSDNSPAMGASLGNFTSPPPDPSYAQAQAYMDANPLPEGTGKEQYVQGILPGILIPENASPVQQFTEGLRRGYTKQIGDEGHYSQSVISSPPRPQDETDLNPIGKTGVVLGALGGDLMGHGTRKFFWNVQPEDVTGTYGKKFLEGAPRVAQIAGGYGATLALGVGSGILNPMNLAQGGRPAGYEAASPDADDPRQSTSPITDLILQRGLLGRKGRLLPWEQFHEERPDVSYEKYADYKDYLFNKNPDTLNKVLGTATMGLVKANLDGINGPELSVMGYGVTPLGAAAALGTLGAVAAGARQVAKLR